MKRLRFLLCWYPDALTAVVLFAVGTVCIALSTLAVWLDSAALFFSTLPTGCAFLGLGLIKWARAYEQQFEEGRFSVPPGGVSNTRRSSSINSVVKPKSRVTETENAGESRL